MLIMIKDGPPCPDCAQRMMPLDHIPAGHPNQFYCEHCTSWWRYDGQNFMDKREMRRECPEHHTLMEYIVGSPDVDRKHYCKKCRGTWTAQDVWHDEWRFQPDPDKLLGERCPECGTGPMTDTERVSCLCGHHIYHCVQCDKYWTDNHKHEGKLQEVDHPKGDE